jgi:hypothetical protein
MPACPHWDGLSAVRDPAGWLDAVKGASVQHVGELAVGGARRPPVAAAVEFPVAHGSLVAAEVGVERVGVFSDGLVQDVPGGQAGLIAPVEDDVLVGRGI